jgi:ribokinase
MCSPILVVGSANLDQVMRVSRLPAPGETVLGGTYREALGGKGANQAVAAARSGAAVRFLAALGNDEAGDRMSEAFAREGIDGRWIQRSDNSATGRATILVDNAGENAIAVASGANARLDLADAKLRGAIFADCRSLLLQLEIPAEVCKTAVTEAADRGVPVLLNYAPAIGTPIPVDDRIDTLIVNEVEAGQLLGRIVDPLTDVEHEIRAAKAGKLIGMAVSRPVLAGYGLFHVAWTH